MWVLDRPAALLLLVLIPIGAYFRHVWKGRGGKIVFPFSNWGGRGFVPPANVVSVFIWVAAVSFWAGVGFLIVGLSGPQRVTREQVFITRGVDVVIAIDQSPTMGAKDFRPDNRFEAAKSVVADFVQSRENDPIGLVGFGREASLRVPPTLDYDHLLSVLERMTVWELGDGTAIGMGLAVAALHLANSSAPRRVIILITDGVNNAGEILPGTAAQAARSLGIQIYVIGMGSGTAVEFEAVNPQTGENQRGTVEDGFNEALLREVAAQGGGAYFYAGTNGALSAVFEAIGTVERVEQRSLLRVHTEAQYHVFVIVGLCCILFDFLIRRLVARELM